ncbi:MAG: erythromycin esterase family protein [Chloroflexi bacterium]|nr:erythromycin esterase family protein [Chloroflexota bacterium]
MSRHDAFVAWARTAAIPFPDLDDDADAERLAPLLEPLLGPLLAGKRVAYLGEPDHWIEQKTAYHSVFLRYLCPRGWSCVGEEFGWFDGKLIDLYIETGDESLFERVAMFGYKGAERPDRSDQITGLLKAAGEDAYPTAAFRAHHLRLARTLRAMSQARATSSPRIRYFGFDVDASPNSGYEHIGESLRGAPASAGLAEVRARLERVPGESMQDEVRRLDGVLAAFDTHRPEIEDGMGTAWADELRYSFEALRDNFDYARVVYPATSWDTVAEGMAMREHLMQRHVRRVLDQHPGEGVVLMAHNMHLTKDDTRIRAPGIGPGGGKERAVGTWLNHQLPEQVLSVWMLFERGRDNQPFPDLPTKLSSPPGSVNALLGQVGDAFALPTRSQDKRANALSSTGDIVMLYNQASRLALADQADVVFFVREVSPLRF